MIPVKNKAPTIPEVIPYRKKRATEKEIKKWFGNGSRNQIAVIAGEISGNLEIIDFDCGGLKMKDWLAKIPVKIRDKLVIEKTPSGGFHVIYKCNEISIPGSRKLAMKRFEFDKPDGTKVKLYGKEYDVKDKGVILAAIETRGSRGYTVVAPSIGYKLLKKDFNNIPILTEKERNILIDAAIELNEYFPPPKPVKQIDNSFRDFDGTRPGDIYNQGKDFIRVLQDHGWEFTGRSSALSDGTDVVFMRRPGKRHGTSASIIGGKIFYCFTSNGGVFEEGKSYLPFAVYTLLEHNGDFSEAAKTLGQVLGIVKNKEELKWEDDFKEILENRYKTIQEARTAIESAKDYSELKEKIIPLCSGLEELWQLEKVIRHKVKQLTGSTPPINKVRDWLKQTEKRKLVKLPEWAKDWVYLYYHNKFFSLKTKEMISERAFNLLMSQHSDEKNIGELLTSSGLMPIYSNAIYLPGAAEEFEFEGKPCVNLFKMWPPASGEMNPEVVEIVLEHAKRRFPEDWKLLIDFLAWCVQNPGKKLAWVMFVQGIQGDGKTYWSRMMTTIMGAANTKEIDPVAVKSNFTGWAEGCLFAVMEEIRLAGQNRYEIMDRTKSIFTNPRISIHRKGLDPYDAPNVTNYLLLTNHQDALPLHHDDRRYCILFSSCQYKDQLEDRKYFDRLYSTLGDRNSLLLWLENWEISPDFSQFQAPLDTESRDEMIEINKSELRLLLEDYLGNLPTYQELIYNKDIAEWLRLGGYRFAPTSIGKEMVNMGFERKRDSDKRAYIRRLPF